MSNISPVIARMSALQRRVIRDAGINGWKYNDDRSVTEGVMVFEKDGNDTLFVDMADTYVRAFWDAGLHVTGHNATKNLLAFVGKF